MCKSPIYRRDGIQSYTINSIIRTLVNPLLFHIMTSVCAIVMPVHRKRSHYYDPKEQNVKLVPYKVLKGFDKYKYLQI